MSEHQENKEIRKQIEFLKTSCLKYENETNNEEKIEEEKLKLENEVSVLIKENNEKKKELEKLKNYYQNILNSQNVNNENEIKSKEKELHDLKAINNNLNKELKLIQDTCDMLKDENYIIKILGYWSPQAMFKYIQAYDKQQTPNQ
jgi:hypothetical protein